MSFSEKINMIRNHNKLSQEEMADKLDVSRQTISKWESGISYPEIDKLISISEIFEVSVDYLLKDQYIDRTVNNGLEKVIFQFLGLSQEMNKVSEQLIDIMSDGIIDESELVQLENIMHSLDEVEASISRIRQTVQSCMK